MSTTFGVLTEPNYKVIEIDDMPVIEEDDEDFFEIVAFRSSHGMSWLNNLAPLLPDDLVVYPLDNSRQGINTIGDIRKQIKSK